MTESLDAKAESTVTVWNTVLFPKFEIKTLKEIKLAGISCVDKLRGEEKQGWGILRCALPVGFIRHSSEFSQNSCCCNAPEAKTCQLSISDVPRSWLAKVAEVQLNHLKRWQNRHSSERCLPHPLRTDRASPSLPPQPRLSCFDWWTLSGNTINQNWGFVRWLFPEWWPCSWGNNSRTCTAFSIPCAQHSIKSYLETPWQFIS